MQPLFSTTKYLLLLPILLTLANCGYGELTHKEPPPCIFDFECDEGYQCIDNACVYVGIIDPDG